jgi:thymidylate synthase
MIVWSDDAWKNSDTENLNNVELLEDPLDTWTQWQYVLDELAADNDSRRAVMHIRSPLDSRYAKLDVPCTLTLQFFLRDDKVVLNVSMRSSDLWLGIANDIPAFTLFQELMAFELSKKLGRRIGLGEYVHTSNSLHIYERNFSAVENVLAAHPRHVSLATIPMPAFTTPPPIIELMNFESALYQPDVQFQKLLDELHDTFETSGVDQYWYDWAVLLVQRASGKDGVQRRDYLNQCIWPGYKILG